VQIVKDLPTASPVAEQPSAAPTEAPAATTVPTAAELPTAAPTATSEAAQPAQSGVKTSGFVKVRFFDAAAGWGVDSLGNVLRTTKGMISWKNVSPPGAKPGVGPSEVTAFFLDPAHAWAVYRPEGGGPLNSVVVWSTADTGQTWKKSDPIQVSDEGLAPVQLFFSDETHGWFLGQIYPGMNHVFAVLYATQDGGATWTLVSDSTTGGEKALPGSYSLPYGSDLVTFVDDRRGFAGGENLYQTTDGGATWTAAALPDPPNAPALANPFGYVAPPQFATPQDGILVHTLYLYDNVFCPPCDISDKLPAAVTVYFTHDGGETWTPVPAPDNLGQAGLADDRRGWFVGRENTGSANASIYLTNDGGQTWTLQAKDSPVPVCARLEFAGDTIYAQSLDVHGTYPVQADSFRAAWSQPFLYESKDGGKTWAPVLTSPVP
jgi:photosystem II stability/assembly factor-like uncharacterized protein